LREDAHTTDAKEKLKAMMSAIREADEAPKATAEADFEEHVEGILEQARAAARAQG
jgi:hypothetical protein